MGALIRARPGAGATHYVPTVERSDQCGTLNPAELNDFFVDNAYDIAVHATARWDFWQPYVTSYSAHWVQDDYNARDVWLAK